MVTSAFQPYYESEAFQEYHHACLVTNDFMRQAQIIEQQVNHTSGCEKAFWMSLRYERRRNTHRSPRELQNLWSDLGEILAIDPHAPGVVECVVVKAVQLYWISEHSGQPGKMLPVFRSFRSEGLMNMLVRQCLGGLALRKRRWYSAYRHFSLSLDAFQALSDAERKATEFSTQHQYAQRAQAAAILGWMALAQADVAKAEALAASTPPGKAINFPLALAKAHVAHLQGRYQDARSILHYADATTPPWGRPIQADIDFLLVAARITRAEGNMQSFGHFCEQAQALCTEHDMPLTAAAVQAVVNGAEF